MIKVKDFMVSSARIPTAFVAYIPALLLCFSILFMQTPLPLFPTVMWPNIALLCIIFWVPRFPHYLPPWLLCVMGILADAIAGAPLGVSACIWLLLSRVLVAPFAVTIADASMMRQWLWVFIFSLPVWAIYWNLYGFAQHAWLPYKDFFVSWVYTSLAYPPFFMAFSSILRRFPRAMNRRLHYRAFKRDRG